MPNTIIVIGGGPIGFSQALGLKKLNPNLSIVVFEKYTEYQRHHTLNMQHQHLREWMQAADLTGSDTLLALEKRLQENAHIRTSELENTLKTMALELGIEIRYEAITQDNIATKLSDYPDTSLIVGADGTHNITNHLFFPPGNQVKYEFDYALQCRYDVTKKRTQPLYAAMLQSGRLAHEYTGPRDAKTGLLPVTTQVIISKQKYQNLKESATSNTDRTVYELRALCHDLHRKFNKGIQRGQATDLLKIEESSLYEAMGNHPGIQGQSHLKAYYHFFKQVSQQQSAATAIQCATLNR